MTIVQFIFDFINQSSFTTFILLHTFIIYNTNICTAGDNTEKTKTDPQPRESALDMRIWRKNAEVNAPLNLSPLFLMHGFRFACRAETLDRWAIFDIQGACKCRNSRLLDSRKDRGCCCRAKCVFFLLVCPRLHVCGLILNALWICQMILCWFRAFCLSFVACGKNGFSTGEYFVVEFTCCTVAVLCFVRF